MNKFEKLKKEFRSNGKMMSDSSGNMNYESANQLIS